MRAEIDVFSICPVLSAQPVRDAFVFNRLTEVFKRHDWEMISGSTHNTVQLVFEGNAWHADIQEMLEAIGRLEKTVVKINIS